MNIEAWKQAWKNDHIGFHKSHPHPLLVDHLPTLNLSRGSRIFLPLCGKTLDIGWLLSQGHQVAGAEISQIAVEQLFLELGLDPLIEKQGKLFRYSANNIDIFLGDIFDLSDELLGPVDAIYDRAAIVALPEELRIKYTKHLTVITDSATQLVITFEYDQSIKAGPPFSVDADEIKWHYEDTYNFKLLQSNQLSGGLKGAQMATENIWQLHIED